MATRARCILSTPPPSRSYLVLALLVFLALVVALAASPRLLWILPHGSGDEASLDRDTRRFVSLGLALGRIAPQEVDSYFGPGELAPPRDGLPPALATLRAELAKLNEDLHGSEAGDPPRRARLQARADRLLALIDSMQRRSPLPFDEEARRLYGLAPVTLDEQSFARARAELDRLLPGTGPLSARVETFQRRYLVPEDRRQVVFARALAECRARTVRHWRLPPGEHIDVEWTSAVDAAWHRYRGNFRSTLQINPQAVAFLGSVVNVACHEGYPGHHAQFVLAEAAAGKGGLPIEDKLVLLRSRGAVLREGAADYAVSLVFPAADRLAFDRDVLFPLAGFPPAEADRFEKIRERIDALGPAALPILRAYRDGEIDEDAAAARLSQEALVASPRPLLRFLDSLGAYVAGYTSVREWVRARIEAVGAPGSDAQWAALRCMLLSAETSSSGPEAGPVCPSIEETKS